MLRVAVRDLQPSMRLARPIPMPNRPTKYLLQRDVQVPPAMIPRLLSLGIHEVWVRHDELAFLEDVIDTQLHERQRELYCNIRSNFEKVMQYSDAQMDFASFQSTVVNLFDYLRNHSVGLTYLDKVQTYDQYLMGHSANVCYLALLLGMKLDWYLIEERRHVAARDAKEVVTLGLGCLLHDVGKTRVPHAVLDKPGRLTDSEMEEIRRHPLYGYEMVRGKIPVQAAQVVLHHHQRWDGKGYPVITDKDGEQVPLSGKRINIFARIATIADVFDAATSKRVYSDAKPPVQVLSELQKWNKGFFDPVIEKAFYEIVPPFPLGSMVRLNNGFTAAVVDFNPQHPCRPRVKPLNYEDGTKCHYPDTREIDLAVERDCHVQYVGDLDVRPFLFDHPPHRLSPSHSDAYYASA